MDDFPIVLKVDLYHLIDLYILAHLEKVNKTNHEIWRHSIFFLNYFNRHEFHVYKFKSFAIVAIQTFQIKKVDKYTLLQKGFKLFLHKLSSHIK